MRATTTQVDIVVLTCTSLKHLLEPISIGVIHEMVLAIGSKTIATGQRCIGIGSCMTKIITVLVGIHNVISAAGNPVNAEVALIVHLQGLVFLTALGRDDNHTVGSTRTVDSTCRSVLQHLNGLDVVRREVTDSCTHGHTVNDIERSSTSERTDTTDTYRWVGTRLTVRGNLYTSHLTFQHRRNV